MGLCNRRYSYFCCVYSLSLNPTLISNLTDSIPVLVFSRSAHIQVNKHVCVYGVVRVYSSAFNVHFDFQYFFFRFKVLFVRRFHWLIEKEAKSDAEFYVAVNDRPDAWKWMYQRFFSAVRSFIRRFICCDTVHVPNRFHSGIVK